MQDEQTEAARLIAIVDDDEAVRRSLARLVSTAGYKPAAYASGVLLLAAIPELQPACIVLDFNMPELNGHAVQAALAEQGHDIPVILITGQPDARVARRAKDLGAVACLTKPVDGKTLLEAIAAALAGP